MGFVSVVRRIRLFRSPLGQILVTIVLTALVVSHLDRYQNQQDTSRELTTRPQTDKLLLFWYQGTSYYGFGEGSDVFRRCPVSACSITADRDQLHRADVVLFSAPQIIPDQLPHHTNNKQLFLFFGFESPLTISPIRTSNISTFFDLTMTYMDNNETDIYVPYGMVIPRQNKSDAFLPSDREIKAKNRYIAWLASNCRPRSSRKEYTEELSKYVKIDVYGKCGDRECPKANGPCFRKIVTEHLFMLAFENSYCDGYISEKLFRTMKANIVPIVLGGADYAKVLPKHSYIDVRDYRSPKHLADHLKYLYKNRTAYKEYFAWKRDYFAVEREYTRPMAICKVCELLHNKDYQFQRHINVSQYWNSERHCLYGNAERKAVHLI